MNNLCIPTIITDSKVKWPLKVKSLRFTSTFFSTFHSITNVDIPATNCNPATTENTDNSHLQMGSHASCYHELTPWIVSKKKWDTKEVKGKSMMRAFYIHLRMDETTLNSEKIKAVVLKLHLSCRQAGRQSAENSIE